METSRQNISHSLEFRRRFHAESQVDGETSRARFEPIEKLFVRLVGQRRESKRSAELLALLHEDHVMPTKCSDRGPLRVLQDHRQPRELA